MQNTTTSAEQPSKLAENFFISGMSQALLTSTFGPGKIRKVSPQILFSMYSDPSAYQKYVQFIFPAQIFLSYEHAPPTFHTFESTDFNGNQSFFHCFIFHEELNELQLREDFDYQPLQQLRLKRLKERQKRQQDEHKRLQEAAAKRNEELRRQADAESRGYRFENQEDEQMRDSSKKQKWTFAPNSGRVSQNHHTKDTAEGAPRPDSDELLMDPSHHDDISGTGNHMRHHERSMRYELNDAKHLRASQMNGQHAPVGTAEQRQAAAVLEKKRTLAKRQHHVPLIPQEELEAEAEYLENMRKTKHLEAKNKFGDLFQISEQLPASGAGPATGRAHRGAYRQVASSIRSARLTRDDQSEMAFPGQGISDGYGLDYLQNEHSSSKPGDQANNDNSQGGSSGGNTRSVKRGHNEMSPMGQNRDGLDKTKRTDISYSQIQHERSGAGRVQANNYLGSSFVGNKHFQKGQNNNLKNSNIESTNSQRSKRSHSSLHPSVLDLDNRRGMQEIISHTNKKSRPPHTRATRVGARRRSSRSRRTKAAGLTKDNSFVQTTILMTETNFGQNSFNATDHQIASNEGYTQTPGSAGKWQPQQLQTARERGVGALAIDESGMTRGSRVPAPKAGRAGGRQEPGPTPQWSNLQPHDGYGPHGFGDDQNMNDSIRESIPHFMNAEKMASFVSAAPSTNSFIQNDQRSFNNPDGYQNLKHPAEEDIEWQQQEKLAKARLYTPVAFVIQSKCEFHDAFKIILQRIYESLQSPKQYPRSIAAAFRQQIASKDAHIIPGISRCMSFAEVITHMAFLRTIPAPVFNSQVNISFMDRLLCIKENSFNEIPHKSMDAIKILVECLDFSSILTCLKALLFDKTLIMFSMETSLLFNVVEGLKQLMFPFTVDFQQFLPANDNYVDANGMTLKGLFEEFQGMQPVIFALNTAYGGDEYETYYSRPDSVLLDIDASYVSPSQEMEGELPAFPKELEYLKLLNRIKNKAFDNYDKVYPNDNIPDDVDPENLKIVQIREAVFRMLEPYLTPAYLAIRIRDKTKVPKNLNDYFRREDYEDLLQETLPEDGRIAHKYLNFARRLLESRSFVHFMDGFIEDQIMNFDLVNSILCFRGQLHRRYKLPSLSLRQFDDELKSKFTDLTGSQLVELHKKYLASKQDVNSFRDDCVHFNFQLPNFSQRMMLFEKMQYIIEKPHDKKRGMVRAQKQIRNSKRHRESAKSNKYLDEIEEFNSMRFVFKELIGLIRGVYKGEKALKEEEARKSKELIKIDSAEDQLQRMWKEQLPGWSPEGLLQNYASAQTADFQGEDQDRPKPDRQDIVRDSKNSSFSKATANFPGSFGLRREADQFISGKNAAESSNTPLVGQGEEPNSGLQRTAKGARATKASAAPSLTLTNLAAVTGGSPMGAAGARHEGQTPLSDTPRFHAQAFRSTGLKSKPALSACHSEPPTLARKRSSMEYGELGSSDEEEANEEQQNPLLMMDAQYRSSCCIEEGASVLEQSGNEKSPSIVVEPEVPELKISSTQSEELSSSHIEDSNPGSIARAFGVSVKAPHDILKLEISMNRLETRMMEENKQGQLGKKESDNIGNRWPSKDQLEQPMASGGKSDGRQRAYPSQSSSQAPKSSGLFKTMNDEAFEEREGLSSSMLKLTNDLGAKDSVMTSRFGETSSFQNPNMASSPEHRLTLNMCDGPSSGAHVSFHQRQDTSKKSGASGMIPKSRIVDYSSRIEEEANSGEPDVELCQSESVRGYRSSAHTIQEDVQIKNAMIGTNLWSAAAVKGSDRLQHAPPKKKTAKQLLSSQTFGQLFSQAEIPSDPLRESATSALSAFTGYIEEPQQLMAPEEPRDGGMKVMYGRQGFLHFLDNLYVLFKEKDKLKVNFYFTIRDMIVDYCEKMAGGQEYSSSQNDTTWQSHDKHEVESTVFSGLLPSRRQSVTQNVNVELGAAAVPNEQLFWGVNKQNVAAQQVDAAGREPSTLFLSNQTARPVREKSIIMSMGPNPNRVTEIKSMMMKHLEDTRGGRAKQQTVWSNCLLKSSMTPAITGQSQNQGQMSRKSSMSYASPKTQFHQRRKIEKAESQILLAPVMQKSHSFNPSAAKGIADHAQDLMKQAEAELLESQASNVNGSNEDSEFEVENPIWFCIEKDVENRSDKSTTDRDWENKGPITYQEVMTFTKMVSSFEDKRYQSQMILWLMLHFPLNEQQICKFNKQIKTMLQGKSSSNRGTEGPGLAIDENFRQPHDEDGDWTNSEEYESETDSEDGIYDHTEKLEYLFPLSYLQFILDNLCRSQVMDLYLRVSNDQAQSENYSQELSQIDREFTWRIKHGCWEARSNNKVPQYKDVFKLLIKAKFDETIANMQEEKHVYHDLLGELKAALSSSGGADQEQNKKASAPREPAENKRDKMRNNYFETVDERLFQESSTDRIALLAEYAECMKTIEQNRPKMTKLKGREEEKYSGQMSRDAAAASVTLPDLLAAVFDGPDQKSERRSKGKKNLSAAVGRSSSTGGTQAVAGEDPCSPAQGRKIKRASGFFSSLFFKKGSKEQKETEDAGDRHSVAVKFGQSPAHAQSIKDSQKPQKLSQTTQNSKSANASSTVDAVSSLQASGPQRPSGVRHSRNQSDMAAGNSKGLRRGQAPQQAGADVKIPEESKNMLNPDTSSAGVQELLARRAQDSRDSRRVNAESGGKDGYFKGPNEAITSMKEKLQKLSAGIHGQPPERDSFSFNRKAHSVKKVKTPITYSIKLLSAVIDFWTRKEDGVANELLLNKGVVFDGKASNAQLKQKRLAFLRAHVHRYLSGIEAIEPIFKKPDNDGDGFSSIIQRNMSDEEYSELAKQCFYLNIYNALILFKLTEMAVMKSTKLFGLKNQSSWIALQQNASITINGRSFTAFQLKYDVIKNTTGKPPSTFAVDSSRVHPLIDYAFFLPIGGSLKLSELCFTGVADLQGNLSRKVKLNLIPKIKINEDFGLIMLPSSLKECFPPSALKINHDEGFARQKYQLNILKFIQKEIIQGGDGGYRGAAGSAPGGRQNLSDLEKIIYKLECQSQGKFSFGKKPTVDPSQPRMKLGGPKDYVIDWQSHGTVLRPKKIMEGLARFASDTLALYKERLVVLEESLTEL